MLGIHLFSSKSSAKGYYGFEPSIAIILLRSTVEREGNSRHQRATIYGDCKEEQEGLCVFVCIEERECV